MKATWCSWTYLVVQDCPEHASGHPHADVVSPLGPNDEPSGSGAVVIVWAGDYRHQQVWVASGANVGNWYCLGGEFGVPKVWDPPQREPWSFDRSPAPPRPAGTIPLHPDWHFLLTRGPVWPMSFNYIEAYRNGWRNGRRRLHEEIESMADDDFGADDRNDGVA